MLLGKELFFTIVIISVVTFLTRAFPFILFDKNSSAPPKIVTYLGKYLPPAIISCILVYCFKDTNFKTAPYGLREISSFLIVVGLYLYKRNSMVSILCGTTVYMLFTYYFF